MNEEYYISLIGEAFDGYSETTLNDKTAYIKHVSIKDQRYLHKYYERYKTLATQKGLETSEERLTRVKNDGMWSSEDDGKISSLEFELKNLRVTQKNLPLPSQRQKLGEEIKEKEQDLISLKSKRDYRQNRR